MKEKKIEEQLKMIEKRLANAEVYVSQEVNVEGTSFLHFDDWQGKSGHPSWMKNFMIPTMTKHLARKEEALDSIKKKRKDKDITQRKRMGKCDS